MGFLYVIESGSDACGKATQSRLLYEYFLNKHKKVKKIEFPNYKSDSSLFVKMYLAGEFGNSPEDVDPYITSTFFALDRYVTFKKELEKFYNDDYIIIADRYTTSNMVYQAGKYDKIEEKDKFLQWLYDYEFNILKLPKPDKVFFLDLPFEISYKLLNLRTEKNKVVSDIHEKDKKYLEKVYENSKYISEKFNWYKIDCSEDKDIKTIEDIHNLIVDGI